MSDLFSPGVTAPAPPGAPTPLTVPPTAAAVQTANNAAPGLDPNVKVALASQQGGLPKIAQDSVATYGFNTAKALADLLNSQDRAVRQAFWNQANELERGMLNSAGFQQPNVPTPADKSHGFWGGLWDGIKNAVEGVPSAAVHDISTVVHGIQAVPGEALSLAAKPLAAVNHTLRSLDYTMSGGEPGGKVLSQSSNPLDLKWLFDPAQWYRAWNATMHGQHTFSPAVVRQLSRELDPLQLNVAKDLAGGMSQADVLAQFAPKKVPQQYGNPVVDSVQNQIVGFFNDPSFMEKVQQLQNAHLDFGRFVVGGDQPSTATSSIGLGNATGGVGSATQAFASGAIDAGVDWNGDPVVVGGKVSQARTIARFAISDSTDLRSLWASEPKVQRMVQGIADAVKNGGAAGVRAYDTNFSGIADELQRARATTPGKVLDYFSSDAGRQAISEGRAGRYYHDTTVFPTLSRAGAIARDSKMAIARNIGKWADMGFTTTADKTPTQMAEDLGFDLGPAAGASTSATEQSGLAKLLSHGARLANRLVTMTPRHPYIDPSANDSGTVLNQWARMYLPGYRADQLQRQWAEATSEGQKYNIFRGLLAEGFNAAGIPEAKDGPSMMSRFLENLDNSYHSKMYSGDNRDIMAGPEGSGVGSERNAILDTQLAMRWEMPTFKEMYHVAKKGYIMRAVDAGSNSAFADAAMTKFWKPSMLLRFGFAVRVAGEEAVAWMLRDGAMTYIKSKAANRYMNFANDSLERNAERNMAVRMFHAVTSHIPIEAVKSIQTPEHLIASVYGWRTVDWLRKAGYEALVPEEVMQSAEAATRHGIFSGSIYSELSSLEHPASGNGEAEIYHAAKEGNPVTVFRLRGPVKEFKRPDVVDEQDVPLVAARYHYALSGVGQSRLGRVVLDHYGEGEDAQRQAAYEFMSDPHNSNLVGRFVRSQKLRDGRVVGVDATKDEAYRDWADVATKHVNSLIEFDGKPIRMADRGFVPTAQAVAAHKAALPGSKSWGTSVIDYMRENDYNVPDAEALQRVPVPTMPASMAAREMIAVHQNAVERLINKGMQEIVGKPIDAISRRPMFLWKYHVGYQENLNRLLDKGMEFAPADRLANDIAQERAFREIQPFIHDPQWRSQFSIITRNLIPFWFAQEQQAKRWARTIAVAPEGIRKIELLMNGLRTSGFVHRDPGTNTDYFYYPMAGMAMGLLNDIVPGIKLPVPTGMTGQIAMLAPGLKNFGVPSVGPFVAIPLEFANIIIPGMVPSMKVRELMEKATGTIIGSAGSNEPIWAQLTPTLFSRIYVAIAENDKNSPMLMNAMTQAASYMEANHIGIPRIGENGTTEANYPERLQMFYNRLGKWTHTFALLRAFLGFGMPASPTLKAGDFALNNELAGLMNKVPYDEAVAIFMRLHPDAGAYDVFNTTNPSGAFVPSTDGALKFINDHLPLFQEFSQAAPWLFPVTTQVGPFSDNAYQMSLGLGLRARRDFQQWFQDVEFQRVAGNYFKVKDTIKALQAADPGSKQQIQNWWDNWSKGIEQTNPLFAAQLLSGTAAQRRLTVIAQMQQLLASPGAPQTAEALHMGELMDGFVQLQQFANATQGIDSYRSARTAAKQEFVAWATALAKKYPDIQTYWQSVLSLEVPG